VIPRFREGISLVALSMSIETILIILVVVLLLGGGGFYFGSR